MNQMPQIVSSNKTSVSNIIDARSREQKVILMNRIPELVELERLLLQMPEDVRISIYDQLSVPAKQAEDEIKLPIYGVELGAHKKNQPRLLFIGGVHGLERIGSRVIIALLATWMRRMLWEKSFQYCLQHMSITFIPIANPVGMFLKRRANGNGVDLMRNAPIDAEGKVPLLVGGQRFSKSLPWFRGDQQQLEKENQILEQVVAELEKDSPLLISLDCHSGFGFRDRIWFPYAYRRRPMKGIAPVMALKLLWESNYPNHPYIFEPQSNHYMTHGDLWDYCYKKFSRPPHNHNFLPLTLEMGSWNWVRKKPSQLLSIEGLFNPMTEQRQQRTLRNHLPFFDFLRHVCFSYEHWMPQTDQFNQLRQMADSLWYRER